MIQPAIQITCPECGTTTALAQVQGDRCPRCGFEYKRYGPREHEAAVDYYEALDCPKHLAPLPNGAGWLVAHE